jgi:hypothetical protein
MAMDLSDRVREIAQSRDVPESEVFEEALERGLEALWEEMVLGQYLREEIDRADAVEKVGQERVERAEREVSAVEEDVEWGLSEG